MQQQETKATAKAIRNLDMTNSLPFCDHTSVRWRVEKARLTRRRWKKWGFWLTTTIPLGSNLQSFDITGAGFREGIEYTPFELVRTSTDWLLSLRAALTRTTGTEAPEGSVTDPSIMARKSCVKAEHR